MQLPSTLKDQGNYVDEIQTGMYISIAINELQPVLLCRLSIQYPLVDRLYNDVDNVSLQLWVHCIL